MAFFFSRFSVDNVPFKVVTSCKPQNLFQLTPFFLTKILNFRAYEFLVIDLQNYGKLTN